MQCCRPNTQCADFLEGLVARMSTIVDQLVLLNVEHRRLRLLVRQMAVVLERVLNDGTGDLRSQGKRLWPIRAANYRAANKILRSYNRRRFGGR